MEKNTEKRVLRVELDDEVKKVSITGTNGDEKVVMRQELSEDDLDQATGGKSPRCANDYRHKCDDYSRIPTIGCPNV